jgi:hypothetical protein
MSAEATIRELFRGLEVTIHERLGIIEQVLHTVEKPKVPLYDNEFIKRIENLEKITQIQGQDYDVHSRVNALEEIVLDLQSKFEAFALRATPSEREPEPEVEEANVVVEEEEIVEVVEEEEEEGEELELEAFDYQKITYARDPDGNVYQPVEDGAVEGDPIGKWNGKKIIFYKH